MVGAHIEFVAAKNIVLPETVKYNMYWKFWGWNKIYHNDGRKFPYFPRSWSVSAARHEGWSSDEPDALVEKPNESMEKTQRRASR